MLTAVFCATETEAAHVVKDKNFAFKKIVEAPFAVWRNKSVLLVITGIGLVNASLAFAWAAKKFRFENCVNIGAAGAAVVAEDPRRKPPRIGEFCEISNVGCVEPYNEKIFTLSRGGRTLATSSRPMSTAQERAFAGQIGDLIDMEGYAIASAARIFSKKLSIIKLVTDFSPKCDIKKNIFEMSELFALRGEIWTGLFIEQSPPNFPDA